MNIFSCSFIFIPYHTDIFTFNAQQDSKYAYFPNCQTIPLSLSFFPLKACGVLLKALESQVVKVSHVFVAPQCSINYNAFPNVLI